MGPDIEKWQHGFSSSKNYLDAFKPICQDYTQTNMKRLIFFTFADGLLDVGRNRESVTSQTSTVGYVYGEDPRKKIT